MKDHDCKFEDRVMEISDDVKTLLAEFKGMNGSLKDTKQRFDKHEDESVEFRKKVTEIWAGIHFSKWVIGAILASGLVWHLLGQYAR